MPSFFYKAVDAQGRPVEGWVEAADAEAALAALRRQGFDTSATAVRAEETPAPPAPDEEPVALSPAEALAAAREIAHLAEAGLPLGPGLRALAEEWGGRPAAALRELADRIDRGATLAEAVAELPGRFPATVARLVGAGAASGRLAHVLGELAEIEDQRADQRRRIVQTLAYPMLLVIGWLGVVAFLLVMLVPPIEATFEDFEVRLPSLTLVVLWLAHAVWWVAGVVAALAGLAVLFWMLPGGPALESLRQKVPLAGSIRRYGGLARFARLLALLVEQGTPLPEALHLVRQGVGNPLLARACDRTAERLATGATLAECLTFQSEFPQAMVPMIDWGERHRALDEVLQTLAEMFDCRARIQTDFAGVIALPIILLWFLVTIPTIFSGLILPLLRLIETLS